MRREIVDLRLLGAGFFIHHAGRLSGQPQCEVEIADIGRVKLRPANSDLATIRQILADREYDIPVPAAEHAIRRRYDAIVAGGGVPVIVDAGANIGAASLWLRLRFPKAHLIAIEPDPDSFAVLQANLEGRSPAEAVQAAVGATPGFVEMVTYGDSWANQTERSDSGTRIMTINEAFDRVPNGVPLLAKVDIEGFESDLFSDNLEWLDRITALYLEPHDWRFPGERTSRSFQKALGERDFHLFVVGPNLAYVRI
jgi:FkbM family methyltransferase